jgi:hypothetical protein
MFGGITQSVADRLILKIPEQTLYLPKTRQAKRGEEHHRIVHDADLSDAVH